MCSKKYTNHVAFKIGDNQNSSVSVVGGVINYPPKISWTAG